MGWGGGGGGGGGGGCFRDRLASHPEREKKYSYLPHVMETRAKSQPDGSPGLKADLAFFYM